MTEKQIAQIEMLVVGYYGELGFWKERGQKAKAEGNTRLMDRCASNASGDSMAVYAINETLKVLGYMIVWDEDDRPHIERRPK